MRAEWRWALTAAVALAVGATCAESYARFASPYYAAVATLVADLHPWRVRRVGVAHDPASHGAVLRLVGDVRRHREDSLPAARVVVRVQVGEVIETPIVFWTVLLVWPAETLRRRLVRLVVGLPVFLVLEAATTGCQLVHSLAQASAILAGEQDPVTLWELWSRFLEAGGRFALELGAALLSVAVSARLVRPRGRAIALAAAA